MAGVFSHRIGHPQRRRREQPRVIDGAGQQAPVRERRAQRVTAAGAYRGRRRSINCFPASVCVATHSEFTN